MGDDRNLLKLSDVIKAAHDSLSIALDAAQEYPAYAPQETVPILKNSLSHLEYLADDPSMLLSHTEEEALEEVNAHLNRLLRNYGPEDKLAELHYGPLKEALDLLAGLSPQLLQLRDSSLILRNIFLSGSDRTHESGLNSDRELSKSFSARCGKALDVKLCLRLLYGTEDSTSALYGVKMALHFAIYWRPKLTGLTGR